MHGFEQFLQQKGYVRHKWDARAGAYVPAPKYILSSSEPAGIDHTYIHPETGKRITFGLHEKGLPPTLISPRPPLVNDDCIMNRMLEELPYEEIYQMI